jgi:hypothetical protein
MPATPRQSLAIPFRAAGIAVDLEKRARRRGFRRLAKRIFNPQFII